MCPCSLSKTAWKQTAKIQSPAALRILFKSQMILSNWRDGKDKSVGFHFDLHEETGCILKSGNHMIESACPKLSTGLISHATKPSTPFVSAPLRPPTFQLLANHQTKTQVNEQLSELLMSKNEGIISWNRPAKGPWQSLSWFGHSKTTTAVAARGRRAFEGQRQTSWDSQAIVGASVGARSSPKPWSPATAIADEPSKKDFKDILSLNHRTLLVAAPHGSKSTKFDSAGARARYQKSTAIALDTNQGGG